jgi:hypothetical protein
VRERASCIRLNRSLDSQKNFEAETTSFALILSQLLSLIINMALKFLYVLAAFVSTISAHGYVDNATIGGVFYEVRISASFMSPVDSLV